MKNNDETTMPNEIKLDPNYTGAREHFAREARSAAIGDLDQLLPGIFMGPFDRLIVQYAVFHAMRSVLVPINFCIQSIDSNAAVVECRALVDQITKSVIADAEASYAARHADDDAEDAPEENEESR
jgi:hypothetical protein